MSRFTLPSEEVLRAREKLVLDHFHDEVTQDWDATLSTFPHPHYELIAQMLVHDGDGEVREYYHDTRVAFPDQDHEIIAFRHSVDAVIVEFWLTGTHLGPLGKIPPTGGTHRTRMTAYFIFDENENLVTERIYFDQLTILKQLIGGLDKKKPKDLAKLAGALKGALAMAGTEPDPGFSTPLHPISTTDRSLEPQLAAYRSPATLGARCSTAPTENSIAYSNSLSASNIARDEAAEATAGRPLLCNAAVRCSIPVVSTVP